MLPHHVAWQAHLHMAGSSQPRHYVQQPAQALRPAALCHSATQRGWLTAGASLRVQAKVHDQVVVVLVHHQPAVGDWEAEQPRHGWARKSLCTLRRAG